MLPNSSTSSFFSSRLGLEQTSHANGKKRAERKTVTGRDGPLWESVTITRDHATSPQLKCNNCGETFCGGATRIREHIVNKCKCETSATSCRPRATSSMRRSGTPILTRMSRMRRTSRFERGVGHGWAREMADLRGMYSTWLGLGCASALDPISARARARCSEL